MLHKFVSIVVILSLLAASLVLVGGTVSAAVCIRVTVRFIATRDTTLNGTLTATYSIDGDVIDRVRYENLQNMGVIPSGSNVVIGRFTVENVPDRDSFSVDLSGNVITSGGGTFSAQTDFCGGLELHDGRLNPYDAAALAIIYLNSAQGYDIFAINPATSDGDLVLRVTRERVNVALADATAPGGVNTLIASRGGITLWALNSGECQMNALNGDGSLYEFIFNCAV